MKNEKEKKREKEKEREKRTKNEKIKTTKIKLVNCENLCAVAAKGY